MAITFNFIGLVVADLGRSLDFYRRLGLEIPEISDDEGHVEAALPGGLRLGWDTIETVRTFDPTWTAPTGSHRVALAFDCETPAEVDRVFAEMTEAGFAVHVQPWDAFWGQRYATLLDPDGNAVDLYAPLPA
ncbi:VOC family protein [Glaciibacter psychrotolerans]|uniref:Putative glyoxalase superfamily protein PhnB n=1 Tax=Glaciibacter psychrotolerans TaxID=670054 RepID=A0A7Z0EF60_9MICO|nr:VOC family protein [Leifsonia psychrotolerans]NYJ20383.1 putative glyoxalase superfamily protein PhnB [Leifsonia psychrotolerans]